jgi:DNA-binding response OmpR family regulator
MQMSALKSQAIEQERPAGWDRPRRKRILLVDDQKGVRESISLVLKLDDHTVIEAGDGLAALDLFRRDHFDLVITDFEMPIMKGNELAARIKQHSPAQPILMISAYAERLAGLDNPVDGILVKPFDLQDLRLVLAELLSRAGLDQCKKNRAATGLGAAPQHSPAPRLQSELQLLSPISHI